MAGREKSAAMGISVLTPESGADSLKGQTDSETQGATSSLTGSLVNGIAGPFEEDRGEREHPVYAGRLAYLLRTSAKSPSRVRSTLAFLALPWNIMPQGPRGCEELHWSAGSR